MNKNPLKQLGELGQSVWYDNIHRDMLDDGTLARLVADDGLRGVTSNPSIFDKAISGSGSYDTAIADVLKAHPGLSVEDVFEHLAVRDIRDAADVLRPVYDDSEGRDGMVSIEVSPKLAHDTEGTIAEARRLHAWIDRPNLMVKVPATRAGLPAIETLISEGISINVTLLFSVERYARVVDAYLAGLQARARRGLSIDRIASVASFFVSRVDSAIDPGLEGKHADLRGSVAIANAKVAYRHFQDVFDGSRFEELRSLGAQEQRLLWASTGTKNPDYSDVLYVESLIGPRTVNTMPPATYDAFRDHGRAESRLLSSPEQADAVLHRLPDAGVDLTAVTDKLEADGVQAFVDAYDNLLTGLKGRITELGGTSQAAG